MTKHDARMEEMLVASRRIKIVILFNEGAMRSEPRCRSRRLRGLFFNREHFYSSEAGCRQYRLLFQTQTFLLPNGSSLRLVTCQNALHMWPACQIACPYCAAIIDLVEPSLERHDRAAQEPVVCPHCIVLCPDPFDLTAKEIVDGQFRVLELRENMKRGIERLDDPDKRPCHPGMTNDGLVIATVDPLGAAPEELNRRRSGLAKCFRFKIPNSRIERQLRNEELPDRAFG